MDYYILDYCCLACWVNFLVDNFQSVIKFVLINFHLELAPTLRHSGRGSATETLSPFVERVLAIFCNKSINFYNCVKMGCWDPFRRKPWPFGECCSRAPSTPATLLSGAQLYDLCYSYLYFCVFLNPDNRQIVSMCPTALLYYNFRHRLFDMIKWWILIC